MVYCSITAEQGRLDLLKHKTFRIVLSLGSEESCCASALLQFCSNMSAPLRLLL